MAQKVIYRTGLVIAVVILTGVDFVSCSAGDRSYVFQKCLSSCNASNCEDETTSKSKQPFSLWLLGWDCIAECKHDCMWRTVDAFLRDGSAVPQFYGKWPFVRIFGMQEPASVLFSVLNAIGQLMLLLYRKKVSPTTPMYYVWHGLALVAISAWTCSAVYHSRDTDFTEMMDYFFALAIVMYNVFALFCRVVGTERWWKPICASAVLLVIFIHHIHYMAFIKFDYGYNMKINIAFGVASAIGWLAWCWHCRKKQRYVWQCACTLFAVNLSLLLELLDFPPLWWQLDAHALWHACTAVLTPLWWMFIINDGVYLQDQQQFKKII